MFTLVLIVQIGRELYHPYHFPPSEAPRAQEPVPHGTCRVQVLRSAADWSHGMLKEDSIQREFVTIRMTVLTCRGLHRYD
jgi:hypothetical protein